MIENIEKEAIAIFSEGHPDTTILCSAYMGPLSKGYHGVMLNLRLPSGATGLYSQEVQVSA